MKKGEIARTHVEDPIHRKGHMALVVEELAYHLLDAKIGQENHSYMEQKLGNRNAVSVPAAEWSALALAAVAMLDADSEGFVALSIAMSLMGSWDSWSMRQPPCTQRA